jgi:RNA polymerase sigma-70 factor (ECF subfamily)
VNPNRTHISLIFEELFNQYKEPFTKFADSYVRDKVIAENIFVDAWIECWQKRETLPESTNVGAYLLTAIKRHALNYLRHQRVLTSVHSQLKQQACRELDFRIKSLEDFTTQSLFTEEIKEIVRQTLAEMPYQTQQIFTMSRYDFCKNREIAEKMQISVKTVEFHISKVLSVLRVKLRDYALFSIVFLLY